MVEGGRPDVADRVTDSRVDGEWPVAKDALHGGYHDSVDNAITALRGGSHGLGWLPLLGRSTIFSDALWMGDTDQSCGIHNTCDNSRDTQSS